MKPGNNFLARLHSIVLSVLQSLFLTTPRLQKIRVSAKPNGRPRTSDYSKIHPPSTTQL